MVACLGALLLAGAAFAQEPPPDGEAPVVTAPAPEPAPIPPPTPDPAPESKPRPAPAPPPASRPSAAPPRAVRTAAESVPPVSTPARGARPSRQVSPIDRLKPALSRKSARRVVGTSDRKARARPVGQAKTARPGPKRARPAISSRVRDDDSEALSALRPVLILTFGVSALFLCLAAVPLAWSRRFGFSVNLANVRGAIAVVGLFILLDSAVLAVLFAI
jgi:hypothetical protein